MRQSLGATLVLFVLLMGLFLGRHLLFPLEGAEDAVANPMPLGATLDRLAKGVEWVHVAVSAAFAFFTAISVTRLVSRNLVFPVRTHVFLPLLAVIGFGIAVRGGNASAVVAMFLLSRGNEYFAAAFRRTARPGDLFGGGLMFGLAVLFYAPAAVWLALIPVAMPIYMRNLREGILALTGALLPLFASCYADWVMGGEFLTTLTHIADAVTARMSVPELSVARLAVAGIVAMMVVVSLVSFASDARKVRTRAYRIHLYMICSLFIGLAGLRSVGDLPLAAIPMSIVGASWFSRHEGVVPTIVYILTLLTAVAANVVL